MKDHKQTLTDEMIEEQSRIIEDLKEIAKREEAKLMAACEQKDEQSTEGGYSSRNGKRKLESGLARTSLIEHILEGKEIERVKKMATITKCGPGHKTLEDLKNDSAIADYLKGAISATSYGPEARNTGKFNITFSTVTQRQEAVKASKNNRPKNAQGDFMYLNNKNTAMQDYKIKMLYREMNIAKGKYKGTRTIKMNPRSGKILMIIEDKEKVIIRRDADTPEPTWLINPEDLNNEEKVLKLVEPAEVKLAGSK